MAIAHQNATVNFLFSCWLVAKCWLFSGSHVAGRSKVPARK